MTEVTDIDSLQQRATELDNQDPLRGYRDEFHIPVDEHGQPEIYFVGNSLGLQPKQTESYVLDDLQSWKSRGVRGHFEGEFPWMPYHEFLTKPMANIVGGQENEVVMMNSLTVNLHLMMATFYRPDGERKKILLEDHAFPSDHYAIESQIKWNQLDPETEMITLKPEDNARLLPTEKILQAIDYYQDKLALVLLPGVQYYTGQVLEMPAITEAAHKYKIPVGFDLAHAAGNIELKLHEWDIDFAVWCSYKYLNSGPGSVGGCFVHERHAKNTNLNRLAGWWGQNKATRFLMDNQFDPIPTVEGWQLSNPPILSLAAIRGSLDLFERAGMESLINKSKLLTGFFIDCLDSLLSDRIEIVTPRDEKFRGCQLSLEVKLQNVPGKEVYEKLEAGGVRTDWREPNVIRAAPVPFYNSFSDVLEFCRQLGRALG